MIPPYTLFDSDVGPHTEKLSDDFILEMIVLVDYADPKMSDVAEVFGLSVTELYAFFRDWASHASQMSTAEAWAHTLGLGEEDADAVQDILAPAVAKAQQCIEHGVNFVDHSYDILATLDAARDQQDFSFLDGVNSLEELEKTHQFFQRGVDAVNELLAKRRVGFEGDA